MDFVAEALDQVFIDDTVGSSEEGKDMRDEVTLVVIELVVPVVEILGQVHLLSSPETCLSLDKNVSVCGRDKVATIAATFLYIIQIYKRG